MTQTNKKQKKVKVRGTGTYDLETLGFKFKAFDVAPSTQTNVKTCQGGGKTWETTGADPSRMVSLKCKVKEADQYAELARQFNALTRDLKPKNPVELPSQQRVVNEQGLQCWLDEQRQELTFTGCISLQRHSRDWQAEVLRLVQLVVRRMPASEKFNKVIDDIKNRGGQNHV